MTSPTPRDRRRLLEVVRALFDDPAPDPGAADREVGRELLGGVFRADVYWSLEVTFASPSGRIFDTQPSWAAQQTPPGFAMPDELLVDHPFFGHYARPAAFEPVRASDVLPGRAWRSTVAYSVVDEMLGTTHPLAVPLRRAPFGGVVIMRADRDFTDRDRELATRLQPLLVTVDRHIAQLSEWRAGAAAPRALDGVRPTEAVADLRVTPRQLAVLLAMAEGLTTEAIARRLQLSPRTIGKHQENLYRKLGTTDRLSTVLRAQGLGLIGVPVGAGAPVAGSDAPAADGCAVCGRPTSPLGIGRPRTYCSPACRQRAYRERSGPTGRGPGRVR